MLLSFNTWNFGSVKVERGEAFGCVVPYALGAKAHKLHVDMGERIGKLVEQYVEVIGKISGSLFEL